MLQPKRMKFRKMMKGRNRGLAHRGSKISSGNTALKLLVAAASLRVRSKQAVVRSHVT